MQNVRQSLWVPAAMIAVGIALTLAILMAADRQAPAGVGPSAYPLPCLYLPVIRLNSGSASPDQATSGSLPIAPMAYPPPGPCGLDIGLRTYLPIIQR
jgi:hypothetical protein